jgi:hypothetical protein
MKRRRGKYHGPPACIVQAKNIGVIFGQFLPFQFHSQSKEWNLYVICKYAVAGKVHPPNIWNCGMLKRNASLNEQYIAQGRPYLTRICLAFSSL